MLRAHLHVLSTICQTAASTNRCNQEVLRHPLDLGRESTFLLVDCMDRMADPISGQEFEICFKLFCIILGGLSLHMWSGQVPLLVYIHVDAHECIVNFLV
uniref:Uncharacterized protein n=1 Tax=Picea sitchensis TaxID=3332 RepID=D5A8H9_PICSI|nr:unknown [Picea sitchensis]